MMYKLFPTLVAEYDLSEKIDNEDIMKKIGISGLQMHGVLDKGMSSYLGGYDCALTRLAMKDLQNAIKECLDDYCKEAGLEETKLRYHSLRRACTTSTRRQVHSPLPA